MPDRWFMNALIDYGLPTGYRAEVATDTPCHLWLRWSRNKPQRHPRARKLRGVWLMGDVYYCFTAYNDIEQVEAGDTTTHTFIMSDWPACETRWFYLWGEIGGLATPSESPIWGRHLYSTDHVYNEQISHNNDDAWVIAGNFQSCPTTCPSVLRAGRHQTQAQMVGSFLRFRDLQLPQNSSVSLAYLTFTGKTHFTNMGINTRISFEQADSPPDFSGLSFAQAWSRAGNHGAQVDFDNIEVWLPDIEYISVNIASIVTTHLARPGWTKGNPAVIFWDDFDHRTAWNANNKRCAYPYNVSPGKAVKLHVEYKEWTLEGVLP